MTDMLNEYAALVGEDVIHHLHQLARPLKGMKVVHVNSTREGGGVAEILHRMIPMKRELGIDAVWEVITGDTAFYQCTKMMHNTLQGNRADIAEDLLNHFESVNAENYERLADILSDADVVFIHDPQPAPLLKLCRERRGKWIWRCHIDVSHPYRPVWKYMRRFVEAYDASVFSLSMFAQPMSHTIYLVPPSIDPFSDKNIELEESEIRETARLYGIDMQRPIISQVSRFDRFKDPVGVIQAYRIARSFGPSLQVVLAGGTATDDPEGEEVLAEVNAAADNDPDVHVLMLPPDAHRVINAIQRMSDIVLQKSLREGFGLTVTEAMWKSRPVIGGDTGGIRLQIVNHHTGFRVNSPEGAALRIRYLLQHRNRLLEMGKKARNFVLENYLLTRHLREYLTLMVATVRGARDRIEV
ncbi:MAG TPA: glycosyltransferase [Desulfobacterales bacterium]